MADLSALRNILDQFPQYTFLLSDPEVGPLLARAADPNQPFSQTRFEAELQKTYWYRSRSAGARAWEILGNSDPMEAYRRYQAARYQVAQISHNMGYHFTDPEWEFITRYNLQNGIEIGGPEFMMSLREAMRYRGPGRVIQGAIQGNMDNIYLRAKGDYFVALPENEVFAWATDQALGFMDDDAIDYNLRAWSQSKYPWLKPQLEGGQSMKDIFSGHMQTLAEEWEITPEQIDVFGPAMQQVVGRRDPNTQQMRAASLYEAKVLARRDDQFYRTSRWKQMDAGTTNSLLQAFGKRVA